VDRYGNPSQKLEVLLKFGPASGDQNAEMRKLMWSLIGRALLTVLHLLYLADELKPSSKFINLTLVISFYLHVPADPVDDGLITKIPGKNYAISWRKEAVAYAVRAELPPEQGVSSFPDMIQKYKSRQESRRGAIKESGQGDWWNWENEVSQ